MKRILYFYWYVPPFYWHPVYDLHLRNLFFYKKAFDEINIIIATDDDKSENVQKTIESISYFVENANFQVVENDKTARESAFFYGYIVKNLATFDENTAIFFAHNKGVDTIYVPSNDRNNWINIMYHFNLSDIERVNTLLNDVDTCAMGVGRMTHYAPHEFANFLKYRWMFAGTFFWMVPRRIWNYMERNRVLLPNKIGRYSTEGFLGSIFPEDAKEIKCLLPDKQLKENWAEYLTRVLGPTDTKKNINDKD